MIVFPNCKINLGLRITGKRDDGYHDLETVFFPLPLYDALEFVPANDDTFQLTITGLPVPGDESKNLCRLAWQLLRNDHPQVRGIRGHLLKAIPIGAGLGGGSSDGAFSLTALNKFFNLQLSAGELAAYALQLGSDCPFFLNNQPCIAVGRGEIMRPVEINLTGYYVLLVNPGIHISTREAFTALAAWKESHPASGNTEPLEEIIKKGPEHWQGTLSNEFEAPVFAAYPVLQKTREMLVNAGAVYSSLTGTGSCIYGIFNNKIERPRLPSALAVHHIKLTT